MVIGFYKLASALDHMHLKGFSHQDLHRGNVRISYNKSSWKLGDLGSAARFQAEEGYNWEEPTKCRYHINAFCFDCQRSFALSLR